MRRNSDWLTSLAPILQPHPTNLDKVSRIRRNHRIVKGDRCCGNLTILRPHSFWLRRHQAIKLVYCGGIGNMKRLQFLRIFTERKSGE
jgi:hypothetical protein